MSTDYGPQALLKLAERESVINARQAFKFAGLSEGVGYELARRDELPFPILRIGDRIKVPTAGLLAALGLDEASSTAPDNGTDWRAEAKKWERRAKSNRETLRAVLASLNLDDPTANDAA